MSEINDLTRQVQEMDLKDPDNDETSIDLNLRMAKVFQNPDIIEKIYENIGSFEDRKSSLLISSHWYSECARKFQQEGMVNFKSLEDVKEFTELLSNRFLKMGHTNFRFDTSINLCASVEIATGSEGGGDGGDGSEDAGGAMDRAIIGKFLHTFATKIKILEAGVIWRSTEELAACLNQFVNLEDFTFYFFKTATPFEFPLGGEIALPKVKKLSVFHHFEDCGEVRYNVGEQIQPFLLRSFPSMEYFAFRKWRKYEVGKFSSNHFQLYYQFIWNFNHKLHTALIARQQAGFKNLKGLTLEDFSLQFDTNSPQHFPGHRRLLPYKLEHMELFHPYWLHTQGTSDQFTLSDMASFLWTHASTLRVFKISIALYMFVQPVADPSPFPDGIVRIPLDFPPLLQLEKLDLVFDDHMDQVEHRYKVEKDWPIVFPPLSYSKMLPKLKKLNLTIQAKEENVLWVQNIHDHFMPSDAQLEGIEVNLRIKMAIYIHRPEDDKEFNHESWSTPLMQRMSNHPNVKKEIIEEKHVNA